MFTQSQQLRRYNSLTSFNHLRSFKGPMLNRKYITPIAAVTVLLLSGVFLHSLYVGRDVPTSLPDTSLRIAHPLGFSIIAPPKWNCEIRNDSVGLMTPGIYLAPKSAWLSRRYSATLSLSLLAPQEHKRDAGLFVPLTFQGQPAYARKTIGQVGDAVPVFVYTLHFRRSDQWFKFRYRVYASITTLPLSVLEYIKTFDDKQPDT